MTAKIFERIENILKSKNEIIDFKTKIIGIER